MYLTRDAETRQPFLLRINANSQQWCHDGAIRKRDVGKNKETKLTNCWDSLKLINYFMYTCAIRHKQMRFGEACEVVCPEDWIQGRPLVKLFSWKSLRWHGALRNAPRCKATTRTFSKGSCTHLYQRRGNRARELLSETKREMRTPFKNTDDHFSPRYKNNKSGYRPCWHT